MAHTPNLLPGWLGLLGAVLFGAVAVSHLRHLIQTTGQRRSWHACHVLMAVAMGCMYGHPALTGTEAWRVVLAAAGVLAVGWALRDGRVNPVWLLTALDLAAMFSMFSGQPGGPALNWIVVAYLLGVATLWSADAVRRADRDGGPSGRSLLTFLTSPAAEPGSTLALRVVRALPGADLLGDLDINASMSVMALGMAYMVIAMQLT